MGGLEVVDELGGGHRRPVGAPGRRRRSPSSVEDASSGRRPRSAQASCEGAASAAAVVEAEAARGPGRAPGSSVTTSARVRSAVSSVMVVPLWLQVDRTPSAVTRTTPRPRAIWRIPRTAAGGRAACGHPLDGDDGQDGDGAGEEPVGRERRRGRRTARADPSPTRPAVVDTGATVQAGDLGTDVGDRRGHPSGQDRPQAARPIGRCRRPPSTIIAATEQTPIAPASSGTRRRLLGAHVEPGLDADQRGGDGGGPPERGVRRRRGCPDECGEHQELGGGDPAGEHGTGEVAVPAAVDQCQLQGRPGHEGHERGDPEARPATLGATRRPSRPGSSGEAPAAVLGREGHARSGARAPAGAATSAVTSWSDTGAGSRRLDKGVRLSSTRS